MNDYNNPYDPPASLGAETRQGSGVSDGQHHTGRMIEYLGATRPWVLFIAILAYIGSGFAGIGALAMVIAAAVTGGPGRTGGAEMIIVVGVGLLYLLGAVLGVWWGTMLVRYAQAIGRAVENERTQDVEEAILRQKTFWKANGILAIIYIGVLIVGLFIVAIVAALGANL
jgi:hypothetical protein